MSVQHSTDAEFQNMISSGLTLVDFWAEWCGPCKMMLPRLEELANRVGGSAVIAKHNVDTDAEIPSAMRVMSIPTMVLFKDGQPVEKWVGVQEVETLANAIAKHSA